MTTNSLEPNPNGRPKLFREMTNKEILAWNYENISQRAYDSTWLDVVRERTTILEGYLGLQLRNKCQNIENYLWALTCTHPMPGSYKESPK